jgi:hypothetical protein
MSATTPAGSSTPTTGRWSREPGIGVRRLGGFGPPVAVSVAFLLGWNAVSTWPEAPTGDTNFTWMPMGAVVIGLGFAAVGYLAMAVRTAGWLLALSTALWVVPAAMLFLGAFSSGDGFPASASSLMTGLALASLLPTLVVAWWAAFGEVHQVPEEADSPSGS